jgi:hypothetical protein
MNLYLNLNDECSLRRICSSQIIFKLSKNLSCGHFLAFRVVDNDPGRRNIDLGKVGARVGERIEDFHRGKGEEFLSDFRLRLGFFPNSVNGLRVLSMET